ncbi:MAG: hypothetical protein PHH59_06775 [Methylovulum sp.]|uniref:hypothetical protein n=1 Tax=Methylovulum sp. TaxID=1916980 RepID=UPI00263A0ED4|nr:hypothetical protein [Methylovulum sp.]MDD2723710.1 hypothetical protein [Methylovulum sp.]MDD5123316.1 hypothetical protein [Methylovulum sp.]
MNNDIFETIAPTDLRDFLKSKGWLLVEEAIKDGLYVLKNSQYDRRQLAFPIDNSAPDYLDCVETVIQKLVDLENCSFREWMMAFSEMKDDAIGYRIVDQRNESAYIPLNYAIEALKGAKDILLSAAHSVLKPQAYHPKLKRKEAAQLLEKSRFRHTETGSFVIKVSTPVKAMDLQADVFENTPFVRQATLVINQSISQLVEAIEADKMEQLIDKVRQEPKPILSSNFCKALLNFHDANDNADLFLNFKWASIINKPLNTKNTIKIQSDYYSRIEDIRKELKTQEKDKKDIFIGTVEVLAGDLDSSEQRTGDVILDLYQQDGESIRARVNLKAEWHSLAIKAYENAGHYIQIKGTLQAGNQPRIIKDVTSFSIIEDNP